MFFLRVGRSRAFRRGIVLSLLVALAASSVEAAAAMLDDAQVHPESAAVGGGLSGSWCGQDTPAASGKGDALPGGPASASGASGSGPCAPLAFAASYAFGHSHVAAEDHSGHPHGAALLPTFDAHVPGALVRTRAPASVHRAAPRSRPFHRPPRV